MTLMTMPCPYCKLVHREYEPCPNIPSTWAPTPRNSMSKYTKREVAEQIFSLHKNVSIVIGGSTVVSSVDELLELI